MVVRIYTYLLFFSCAYLASGCSQVSNSDDIKIDIDNIEVSLVSANEYSAEFLTSFSLSGEISSDSLIGYSFYISNEALPTIGNTISTVVKDSSMVFFDSNSGDWNLYLSISGLENGQSYFLKIFLEVEGDSHESTVLAFETDVVLIEILSHEVNHLKTRSVGFNTIFRINKDLGFNFSYGYQLFISEDQNPNHLNNVGFDKTEEEGSVYYDREKNVGYIGNPIAFLEPNTKYYYQLFISSGDERIDTGILTFTTEKETYEHGGIVFYDKGETTDDWRYLVAAPPGWYKNEDLTDPTISWGCFNTLVDSTSSYIGTGLENTRRIIDSNCYQEDSTLTAADLAISIDINGFEDWFLPSYGEMSRLIHAENAGLNGYSYWTSTEIDSLYVSGIDSWGYEHHLSKKNLIYVRPIRRY